MKTPDYTDIAEQLWLETPEDASESHERFLECTRDALQTAYASGHRAGMSRLMRVYADVEDGNE